MKLSAEKVANIGSDLLGKLNELISVKTSLFITTMLFSINEGRLIIWLVWIWVLAWHIDNATVVINTVCFTSLHACNCNVHAHERRNANASTVLLKNWAMVTVLNTVRSMESWRKNHILYSMLTIGIWHVQYSSTIQCVHVHIVHLRSALCISIDEMI
jgi:hypothetical protein